jgi:hypothetical protein
MRKLVRLGRRFLWPVPILYLPFGLARHRGHVLRDTAELYISGYPRSANTFAVKAFQQANPGVAVRSHRHIPTFVLQSARHGQPGMVLIRNPRDAAVSWSIYSRIPLEEALEYYCDYYRALLPYREGLFLARFEDVTHDFGGVIQAFNARWLTAYVPFEHTAENVARCHAEIEADYTDAAGTVQETMVARPSRHRRGIKEDLLRRIDGSSALQRRLGKASAMYHSFISERQSGARVDSRLTQVTG